MKKIEEMYAFVTIDDEREGVMAMKGSDGWMPMVGADMDRIKSLLPLAMMTNRDFRILKFDRRVDVTDEYVKKKNEIEVHIKPK